MLTVLLQGDQEVIGEMGVFGKGEAVCADFYHSSNNVVSITPMESVMEIKKFVNLSLWAVCFTHGFGIGITLMCCQLRCSHEGREAIDYILHTSSPSYNKDFYAVRENLNK